MEKIISHIKEWKWYYVVAAFYILYRACSSPETSPDPSPEEIQIENTENSTVKTDNFVLNGLLNGIQDGYYMKNKFGDDLILGGNRVPVPGAEYKFLFKENGEVSLQQTSSKDGQRAYYEGNYKVVKNDEEIVLIECKLSDGKYSNPTMIIEYSKLKKTYTYKEESSGAPSFNLEKIN
tara:strand:- start:7969 stop:8502 length:534 start_codon:yes stop_codon:yes gene_type:complete